MTHAQISDRVHVHLLTADVVDLAAFRSTRLALAPSEPSRPVTGPVSNPPRSISTHARVLVDHRDGPEDIVA